MRKLLVVGLGNSGEEFKNTRHNTGFILLDELFKDAEWELSGSKKNIYFDDDDGVQYLKPQLMMNRSGAALLGPLEKHKAKPEQVVVVYDDIDLPIGSLKISWGRGDGGHNGLKSIVKSLGTRDFSRVRVGVSPTTTSGKLRKPKGEAAVLKHLMGDFKPAELKKIKGLAGELSGFIDTILETKTKGNKRKGGVKGKRSNNSPPPGVLATMNIYN